MENTKFYVTAEELSEAYGICLSKAYKLIRQLNAELEAKGFIIVQDMLKNVSTDMHL